MNVGDTVELVGERNEETAQLFGGEQQRPVAGAQEPVMTAGTRLPGCDNNDRSSDRRSSGYRQLVDSVD